MGPSLHAADLGFFSTLVAAGSLSAAARELAVSTPAVSKRLAQLEGRLGLVLLTRTTRRMQLTPEGELLLREARRILGELEALQQQLGSGRDSPRGLLRVNATLGFGRSHLAPLVAKFVRRHPQVEVQLQLSVQPQPVGDDSWDVCVRFGLPPDARVVARLLAPNRRVLCASPAYLAAHGEPRTPAELVRHACIGIRQGDEAYGLWRLSPVRGKGRAAEAIKTRGPLSTNDGGIAVQWALNGLGIVMRSEWDVAHHLKAGRLVPVLPQWRTPEADIYAVYPQRHQHAPRVRAFVDALAASFGQAGAAAA